MVTSVLANELQPEGFTVISLHPGELSTSPSRTLPEFGTVAHVHFMRHSGLTHGTCLIKSSIARFCTPFFEHAMASSLLSLS